MAGGDRAKAWNMLGDPDALLANETIQRIIAEGAQSSDADLDIVDGQYPEGQGVDEDGDGDGRVGAEESKDEAHGARAGKQSAKFSRSYRHSRCHLELLS